MVEPLSTGVAGVALAKTKLAEYAARGVARVVEPLLPLVLNRRRNRQVAVDAEGETQRLQIHAEGQSQSIGDILHSLKDLQGDLEGTGLTISESHISIGDGLEQTLVLRATDRLECIGSILHSADQEIGDKSVPDKEPNPEFVERFFEAAQDISTDELRVLWGRVLANEIVQPGSVSLLTLRVLRDLSPTIALRFEELCSMAIFIDDVSHARSGFTNNLDLNEIAIVSTLGAEDDLAKLLFHYGFSGRVLLALEEFGLIASDYGSRYIIREGTNCRYGNEAFEIKQTGSPQQREPTEICGISLSLAGLELSRVLNYRTNPGYSEELSKWLQGENLEMRRLSDNALLGRLEP